MQCKGNTYYFDSTTFQFKYLYALWIQGEIKHASSPLGNSSLVRKTDKFKRTEI